MKNKYLLSLAAILLSFSCNQNQSGGDVQTADAAFQKTADEYLAGYLAWRPANGTALGLHKYDGKATDLSKASLEKELARLKEFDQKLSKTDTASLSPKMFYDFRILRSAIKGELFTFEDLGAYNKNPMVYPGAIDISIYIKRNFAPLESRIKSIIAIEKTAPQVFGAAKANLNDSLAKPYIETAIQIAKGAADFLNGDLVAALKDVKNDSLMKAFNAANKAAINAVNGYATWLEKEKLPKATNKYAIGVEN